MRVNSKIAAIVLLIVFFGGIGISKALGLWQTESTKIPAAYASGEYAGQYNPEDIRGSYTFQDVTNAFEIPVNILAEAFGISSKNPAGYAVKDLATDYANLEGQGTPIETASIRTFVALYKGLPISLDEETFLPKPAAELLKEKGKLTPEQLQYVNDHTVELAKASTESGSNSSSQGNSSEKVEAADQTIKGKTTFKEILDWGLPSSEVEEAIGGKIPSTGMAIRDYCLQKGLEFSGVKADLQKRLEAVQK